MKHIRMLDLHAEYELFRDDVRAAALEVLDSQHFIGGPAIAELEQALCERLGVAHAVGVSSGTDALICTMMAMEIGPGDEVILPSFTFFATAGSVWRVGAKPVFVDIDPKTFNLDPGRVEEAVTDKTKAIIAVHLFGQCAEMDAINEIARRHDLKVIEDAAQAIGAQYHGRSACGLGDTACLSFYPTKNLGGFGEGGMILTNDEPLGVRIRQFRNHGESSRYIHERVGGNFRLDTMKAAILLVKLRKLEDFLARRRSNAARYDALLADSPVQAPWTPPHQHHVYHQYSILTDRRDELADYLREHSIDTGIYYAVGLHLQRCFSSLGYGPGSLPVTERASERILSLPCHPMVRDEDVDRVASCIKEFHAVPSGSNGGACLKETTG